MIMFGLLISASLILDFSRQLCRFCGEFIEFTLETSERNCEAFLRTNINQSKKRNFEIIQKVEKGILPLSNDWSDIPMQKINAKKFRVNIPLMEVGNFEAKAFIKLFDGEIKWPDGQRKVKSRKYAVFIFNLSRMTVIIVAFS